MQVMLAVKNPPENSGDIRHPGFDPWVVEDPLEEDTTTQSRMLA